MPTFTRLSLGLCAALMVAVAMPVSVLGGGHASGGPPIPAFVRLLGGRGSDSGYGVAVWRDNSAAVFGRTLSGQLGGQRGSGGGDAVVARYSGRGRLMWVRLLGGAGSDLALRGTFTPDGDVVVVGYAESGRVGGEQGRGKADALVARYSRTGVLRWVRLLGTAGADIATDVVAAADGSIVLSGIIAPRPVTGTLASVEWFAESVMPTRRGIEAMPILRISAFVAKLTGDGDTVFFRRLGGSGGQTFGRGIALGGDGAIYLAGDTTVADFHGQPNAGGFDAFLARFSTAGELEWARLLGFESTDEARSVDVAGDGSVYIAGSAETLGRYCSDEGGVRSCTLVRLNPDMLVAKYTSEGRRVWFRLLRGLEWEYLYDIVAAAAGGIYVSGVTTSPALNHKPTGVVPPSRAMVLAAYDADGNSKWLYFALVGDGSAVASAPNGDLYLAGRARGDFLGQKSAGDGDIALVKFSASSLSAAPAGGTER